MRIKVTAKKLMSNCFDFNRLMYIYYYVNIFILQRFAIIVLTVTATSIYEITVHAVDLVV